MRPRHPAPAAALLFAFAATAVAQEERNTSGGALRPEQAAYDVRHYDLALRVDPKEQRIDGTLTVRAKLLAPMAHLHLDLDGALRVETTREGDHERGFGHADGRLIVDLGGERKAGEEVVVAIRYGGKPRVAPNPPWVGGFTWARTRGGEPWIATSCQGEGGDLWWPCKDHPSDEPESFDLHVEVPKPLVVASNGRLVKKTEKDGWLTWHWHVSTPINNYGIALNIAPYTLLEQQYKSTTGKPFPIQFFVLPESAERARAALPHFLDHLRHMEEVCGPYPFRADKYGIAETPHLGMEHQSIIAYGNGWQLTEWGYDWLHHHELSHEWWANLVTCRDWKDMWIHEGIGTYMQALYMDSRRGRAAYLQHMRGLRMGLGNRRAIAPRESTTTTEIYFGGGGGNDIYNKGACVMHTLRWLMGDEKFFQGLRRMAYPDPALEQVEDGSACRFSDSDEFCAIFAKAHGADLKWFCDVYLHQPALPRLVQERKGGELHLRWELPGELPFPMPVEVVVGDKRQRVAMPEGKATLKVPEGAEVRLDPDGWVLRQTASGRRER